MHRPLQDAQDIQDDDLLLRRITPSQHTVPQPDGTRILNSFAFREKDNEFSMYVAAEITHAKLLGCGIPGQEIIELRAGDVRRLNYDVIRQPDECDDSHVYARARAYKSKNEIHRDCKALAEIVNQRIAASRT